MNFTYDGGGMGKSGTATILVDGKEVAKVRVEKTARSASPPKRRWTSARTPARRWTCPTMCLKFTGELGKIVIDLK